MLMIGAFARNSGKTELACRIIRCRADEEPVVGLKVTTVERTDGRCPHGDTGCGVCSSHAEPWVVSRELDREPTKDTRRLLASGAHEVYWLRALRSDLAGGAADLLRHLPAGRLSVCESNSLRTVVEPGLFLQVRAVGATFTKPSARAVSHLADRVVVSDGRSFDLDLDRISVVDGRWVLRREACAVVIDGIGNGGATERIAALRRTRTTLEPHFDRVEVGPARLGQSARAWSESAAADLPHEWCFVTPPVASGVPPDVVSAMFRRRTEMDLVVAGIRTEGLDVSLALCRRRLLPDVLAALDPGPGALAALGERYAVTELRLGLTDSGVGQERLPEPAAAHRVPVSDPANRSGAETS
jgi:hypothetical protein